MPIKFRCTGCRTKLYVPARWTGTSIVCPRCDARVVVPAGTDGPGLGSLEGPSIEQSLEDLELPGSHAFSAAPFAIDVDAGARSTAVGASRHRRSRGGGTASGASAKPGTSARPGATAKPGVTLPAWVPYALAVAMVVERV